ncbi:MAG: hypothetical protein INF93_17890 [Rhodobacter sp.]|nr:hypothetical protein [Rhodobacter sp.]
MSLEKQLVLILGLAAAATGLSARFLPTSHPVLQRIGLLAPQERLGLVAQPPEACGRAGCRSLPVASRRRRCRRVFPGGHSLLVFPI